MTFFGLQPSDRAAIFKQIHEIVFHGNGGYDWWTVYNLPVFHKIFIFKNIEEHYKKQQEAANGKDLTTKDSDKPLKPQITQKSAKKSETKQVPYTTKLPKK